MNKVLGMQLTERVPERPGLPVRIATTEFLDHCRVGKRLSENTLRAYRSDLSDFLAYAGRACDVRVVSRDTLRSYVRALLDQRHLKATTVRRRIATLKVLFRWLEQEEVIPLSIFHRLDLSVRLPARLPRSLSEDDMRLLLREAETHVVARGRPEPYQDLLLHFILVVLFTTGLRVSELVGARLSDTDLADAMIHVRGKGNRERRVYLPGRQGTAVLRRYVAARKRVVADGEHLLVTASGRPITTNQIRIWLRDLAERAGVSRRITPHMLRHTAATQLLEAGVDIRFVQRLLGHASIATTQIYTLVRDVTLRRRLARADVLAKLARKGR